MSYENQFFYLKKKTIKRCQIIPIAIKDVYHLKEILKCRDQGRGCTYAYHLFCFSNFLNFQNLKHEFEWDKTRDSSERKSWKW